jgi:hypothetical protein
MATKELGHESLGKLDLPDDSSLNNFVWNVNEETLIPESRKRSRKETSSKSEDLLSDRQIGHIVLSLLGRPETDFHSSVKKRMEITSEQIARVDRVLFPS